MSTGAQVAVLDARGVRQSRSQAELHPTERPAVRIVAFGGLALYGALRWGTMLNPAPVLRLLGLVAVAIAVASFGRELRAYLRPLAVIVAVIATIAIFPLAGIPFSWVRHVRIAVTADAIDQGLVALPRALVPYTGINEWVRLVIVLGAGVLLLDAALMLAFAPAPLSDLRRALAALPLVVLAIVPSTLARPPLAYLHGLILFALLAAFMWGERVPRQSVPLAVGIAGLAGSAAMIAAPQLDQHSPWLNPWSLAGSFAPGHIETFDWSQSYGPLNWPRTGREVVDVHAQRPDYWKTEDLDLFDGTGWSIGSTDPGVQPPAPDADAVSKWSQVIQVTLRGMRTTDLIGAGFSWNPQHLTVPYTAGLAPGTWTAISQLQPGDSYKITTYSPRPSAAQLRSAGKTYDALDLQGDLTVGLERVGFGTEQVVFPPFGQGGIPQNISDLMTVTGLEAIRSSPYAGVYALARRLARHAGTQYGFIQRVLAYLSRGYAYDERPPPSRYPPLVAFLMHDKLGYCQQFAGAMALLLRMGGVPARVSTGFTTGTYNSSRHVWVVSDQDAHAWVEAWFPHYGWVRFDPTPAAAPALGGKSLLPPLHGTASAITPHLPVRKAEPTPASSASKITVHPGSNSSVPVIVGAALIVAVLVLTLRTVVRLNEPDGNELLAELERALSRSGRPVSSGVTLVALEHRFRDTPAAAAYVRAIRMLRFGGSNELPTTAQRRALRGQLRYGLGAFGRLRALWALPPRWTPSRDAADRGLHSD